jgi:hypothetical protein
MWRDVVRRRCNCVPVMHSADDTGSAMEDDSSLVSGSNNEAGDVDDDASSSSGSLSSDARSKRQRVSSSGDPSPADLTGAAGRIHSKLCIGEDRPLPVKFHQSATKVMIQMRDSLLNPYTKVPREARMMLLYSGVDVHRRMALTTDEQEREDLRTTTCLLFTLQVLCDQRERGIGLTAGTPSPSLEPAMHPQSPSGAAAGATDTGEGGSQGSEETSTEEAPPQMRKNAYTLQKWHDTSLESVMKRVREEGDDEWTVVLRCTPSTVCRACLEEAPFMPATAGMDGLFNMADLFFSCSASALQQSMLDARDPEESASSFLTLGSAEFLTCANRDLQNQRLAALASGAESEIGQAVLRDMILSFTLPPRVLGRRRHALLTREANAKASENFTAVVNAAHEAAMRGADWSWAEDTNEVHRICALLAGLCMLTTGRGDKDAVRKNDAFRGRVQLTFLQTRSPETGLSRLGYVPHMDQWMIYTVGHNGVPKVELKHTGFDGLCLATLHLMRTVKT